MLLVNARMLFISKDIWYRRLPNNTAVLTIGTNIIASNKSCLTQAYNYWQRRNNTVNKTYIYTLQAQKPQHVQGVWCNQFHKQNCAQPYSTHNYKFCLTCTLHTVCQKDLLAQKLLVKF